MKIELVECEYCGKLVPENKIYVCSSCDMELCRVCMADITHDMICKECDSYIGKYTKHAKEEW